MTTNQQYIPGLILGFCPANERRRYKVNRISLAGRKPRMACFKGTIPSLIYVILVTNHKKYSGVLNCNCCVSDVHNFIGAATRWFALLRKPRHVCYRSYRNFNDADFCHAVSSAPFHVSDIFDDVEDMAWFTSSLLSTIINEHAPMKRKYIRQESVPNMNARLRKAMYSRNMARS